MDFLPVRMYEMIGNDKKITQRTWEEFEEAIKRKKLIIFGAGSALDDIFSKYDDDIEYIVDNDEKKWQCTYQGVNIYSPAKLKEENVEEIIVLISSVFVKSISEQLKEYGCNNIFSKRLMNYYERRPKKCDLEKIEKVKQILSDEESVDTFNKILEKRNNNEMDYSDLYHKDKVQYFDNKIINVQDDEVLVEAGAFDGVTIQNFLNWCGNRYKRIYAYEPLKENFEILKKKVIDMKIPKEKIVLKNIALWNCEEELYFKNGKAGSKIDNAGEIIVQAEALKVDEADKITFVKMDIEGAELKALEGMREIIKKDKPKLAICIYHKYDDLWQIPLYIHELEKDYNLYIRHYHRICEETVLYAIPR